jgi:DNA-binding MarR family transcriptional regulator
MSDRLAYLIRTFDDDVSLGLGIVVVILGFLLRFISPVQALVEMWQFSLLGTAITGLGILLLVVGLIRFFTDRVSIPSIDGQERTLSRKELKRKYSEIGLAKSSSVQAIETLTKEGKPLNRKEIAEKSGLSTSQTANVLKTFVKKGYVLEFQARGTLYYVLAEKGMKLCEDIKASTQGQKTPQTESLQHKLEETWHKSPYYSGEAISGAHRPISIKEKILLEQLVLVFGFFGGLFIHFGVDVDAFGLSTIPLLLTFATIAWLAITILGARKLAGSMGVTTLALAWMSGFILINGEPFTSLGVTLLMSSTAIGAFAVVYSRTQKPL